MLADGTWQTLLLRLGVASAAGFVLGLEREWRGHEAGARTHGLVALSAATILVGALLLSEGLRRAGGSGDPLRVVQGLAQAIGFIAGGLIFVRGSGVRNMTTATSLWMAAALGIVAGAGQFALLAVALLLALLLLATDSVTNRLWRHRVRDRDGNGRMAMPNRRGSLRQAEDEE